MALSALLGTLALRHWIVNARRETTVTLQIDVQARRDRFDCSLVGHEKVGLQVQAPEEISARKYVSVRSASQLDTLPQNVIEAA